jgi:hypothetical protein
MQPLSQRSTAIRCKDRRIGQIDPAQDRAMNRPDQRDRASGERWPAIARRHAVLTRTMRQYPTRVARAARRYS